VAEQRWRLRKLSRPLKLAVQIGVLAIILATIGAVGFIEYSGQPSFCRKCHVMEPYYQSWATSTHNDVKCIECHYAPGLRAEAMGKFQAANQVVKYVTGAYGTKPWAEIEDAACLRSGCHSLRKVEGVVSYSPGQHSNVIVRFDHTQHLGELRRGKQLRCTSCHSQIVQGNHLAVTPQTCNLCHFKKRVTADPVADCVACHRSPPRIVSPAGFVVDHPQYVRDLVSCSSCHQEVVSGTGEAPDSRCYTCHNEPDRLAEFDNTELLHRVHIAEHNVECAQCHTPIEHRTVSLSVTAELDCASCHRSVHEAQQRLYAGIGGHGTETTPSSMFLARVSCEGCHELRKEIRGHEQVNLAGEASCLSCHGIQYANILPSWQQEMDRKVRAAGSAVRGARRAAGSGPSSTRARVDSLLGLAEDNVEFVRLGKGAHNIAYADRLLRASLDLAREAVRTGPLSYRVPSVDLGPEIGENVCLQCHLGVERRTVTFQGTKFNHERHAVDAGLPCTSCHTGLDDHGKNLLSSTADCVGCHHREVSPETCAHCHAGPGGAPERVVSHPVGDFPHDRHTSAGLPCAACHRPPAMSARELDCSTCHGLHHQPEANCLSCHREGAKGRHDIAFAHLQCSQCHGDKAAGLTKWSRQICTVCHVDRVEHNAPVACELCHEIAPIGSGGSDG
jgi:nitrate/TMAO reductase-like tetraheme cytochrome c subunit